ncbi:hypothetical protein [Rhizobium etli]|uniref:hypothetical protein n=1 Tax=Rhizobium etli TaxID=29449 RepID=UPI000A5F08E0|nr:hypothetical protein [Rhizobium etli]
MAEMKHPPTEHDRGNYRYPHAKPRKGADTVPSHSFVLTREQSQLLTQVGNVLPEPGNFPQGRLQLILAGYVFGQIVGRGAFFHVRKVFTKLGWTVKALETDVRHCLCLSALSLSSSSPLLVRRLAAQGAEVLSLGT